MLCFVIVHSIKRMYWHYLFYLQYFFLLVLQDSHCSMGTRVYVGRLSNRARERDVEKFFRGFGRIRDVLLKNGYGFVEFDDSRDAEDAVYELNGRDLMGERVVLEFAKNSRNRDHRGGGGGGAGRGRPPVRTQYRVIVENLSSGVSWQDLKDYMREAGEVSYADAHRPRRNEGVVEFTSSSGMKKALRTLDDTELNGRHIRLIEDNPRGRSRSYSRSRSRSPRRRSRSRSRDRKRRDSKRSKSRSPTRSRSRSVSRSRSREPVSRSPSREKSRSPSKSAERSVSRSRSRSRSRSMD